MPRTETASGPSHEGKARVKYDKGATLAPWKRTCPQFYLRSPEVQQILTWLHDYKRGALGPVQQLEAPLLEYLRVAEAETAAWEEEQYAQLRKKS